MEAEEQALPSKRQKADAESKADDNGASVTGMEDSVRRSTRRPAVSEKAKAALASADTTPAR